MNIAKRFKFSALSGLLLLAGALTVPAIAQDTNEFPGSACHNGDCCSEDFVFDTGADESFLSRDCATDAGLMEDGDGDGTPDASNGEKTFNGNEKAWCFPSVAVSAVDMYGSTCTSTETIYVSQVGNGASLLGLPWQINVDACYRAKEQKYWWPCEGTDATTTNALLVKPDQKVYGKNRGVLPGIFLAGQDGVTTLDMTFSSGLPYSIIPESVARNLGPIEGYTDLSVHHPEILHRLKATGMNTSGQTIFGYLTLKDFDLGVGAAGYEAVVLVSRDENSDFGVMSDNLLQACEVNKELVYDFRAGDNGGLVYAAIDCNRNGVADKIDMEINPDADDDRDGLLDVCQKATGAACLPGGGCQVMPPDFAKITGASYRGNGVSCAQAHCAVRLPASLPGRTPTTPAGPTLF
jgi:hypothetical protein